MIALHDLSAHELSTAYRTRRLSPVEVTRAVLSRIDAWEKRINALRRVQLQGGETIAIFGQGPVGLSATQLAVEMGARVIAIDIAPERRKLAPSSSAPPR
jgi:threonine dehydrogenase-like Zn-dependent dehydrogenase